MARFELQKLYIDGAYSDAGSDATFEAINPANGEVLAQVQRATKEDVERAVVSAEKGQKIWAAMTAMERSRILRRAVDILRERNDELAALETLDTGKAYSETKYVDIVTGADVLEDYAGLVPAIEGEQIPLRDTSFVYTRREPLGVVAGIGAWNYPIQIALWSCTSPGRCRRAGLLRRPTPCPTADAAGPARRLGRHGGRNEQYCIGVSQAPFAVCTLTSGRLWAPSRVPGVAIAGQVYTANLGDRTISSPTSRPIPPSASCCSAARARRSSDLANRLSHWPSTRHQRAAPGHGCARDHPGRPLCRWSAWCDSAGRWRSSTGRARRTSMAWRRRIRGLAACNPGQFTSREEHDSMSTETVEDGAPSRPSARGTREPLQYYSKG